MRMLLVSLSIYVLAAILSMLVAVLIQGIVTTLALTRTKPPPIKAPMAPPPRDNQDDVAVIAAAVYAMLGAWRIVHIETAEHGRVWTAAARASHHTSHNIRSHPKH